MPFFLLVRVRDRTVALAVLNEHASLPLPSAILLFSDPPQSIEREREREREREKRGKILPLRGNVVQLQWISDIVQ